MDLFSIFRKRFFSRSEEKQIVDAIRKAELGTSGEIRVHFSRKIQEEVMKDAKVAFEKLKMHQTDRRNGVLIFIAPGEHQFAILGDEAFHKIAGDDFWQAEKELMAAHFREGNFAKGVICGIEEVGIILKKYFPREENDKNELKDEISYGK